MPSMEITSKSPPQYRIFLRIGLLLFFAMVIFLLWQQIDTQKEQNQDSLVSVLGKTSPNILSTPEHTYSSQPFELTSLRGKVIVLHFWATWCAPCVKELPSLLKAAQTLPSQKIAFVTVAVDRSWKEVEDFFFKYPAIQDLPRYSNLLLDPKGSVSSTFGSSRFPETYFINSNFILEKKILGAIAWEDPSLQKTLMALSKETQ